MSEINKYYFATYSFVYFNPIKIRNEEEEEECDEEECDEEEECDNDEINDARFYMKEFFCAHLCENTKKYCEAEDFIRFAKDFMEDDDDENEKNNFLQESEWIERLSSSAFVCIPKFEYETCGEKYLNERGYTYNGFEYAEYKFSDWCNKDDVQ